MRLIRHVLLGGLLLSLTAVFPAMAQSRVSQRPDHTIFINIDSEPQGIEMYSIPNGPGESPQLVGTTPYQGVVELRWGRALLGKIWHKLEVWTPGGLCVKTYDEETKSYDLTLSFLARTPSGTKQIVELPLESFTYEKGLDYEKLGFIAGNVNLSFSLRDSKPRPEASEVSTAPPKVRTAMLAESGRGKTMFGAVVVNVNEAGAEVFAGDKSAGKAPVRIVLSEGHHTISVQKKGFATWSKEVEVSSRSDVTVDAELQPAAP